MQVASSSIWPKIDHCALFDHLSSFLLDYGFFCSISDPSLFICGLSWHLTSSNLNLLDDFILALNHEFTMKDLGFLHYLLEIQVTSTTNGLLLS